MTPQQRADDLLANWQQRRAVRQEARASRLEMYSDWLTHDVDGLIYQLANTEGLPAHQTIALLSVARDLVSRALAKLDEAVKRDKQNHQGEFCR
jgi:hypothetical protein